MKGTPEYVTPEILEASKPDAAGEAKPKLTQEELDAKYLVVQVPATEKNNINLLKTVTSLPELSSVLSEMDSYKDPVNGEINLEGVRQKVNEMNLSLGQAFGLMRDNGAYDGTPQRIVDEVFAKISNLPSSLQSVYRKVATHYIEEGIAALNK